MLFDCWLPASLQLGISGDFSHLKSLSSPEPRKGILQRAFQSLASVLQAHGKKRNSPASTWVSCSCCRSQQFNIMSRLDECGNRKKNTMPRVMRQSLESHKPQRTPNISRPRQHLCVNLFHLMDALDLEGVPDLEVSSELCPCPA